MKITKTMTNGEIYDIANAIMTFMNEEITLPVKVNFYLQKNVTNMLELGKEVEKARIAIFEKYGALDEEKQQYNFEPDKIEIVTTEVKELMELTQDVSVYMIGLESFNNVELTNTQVAAISFMIEEPEEE